METEYSYLLRLLGAYLREEAPAPADNVDWEKLLELARIHSVIGIVGYMGKKFPICPDQRYSGGFRSLCMSTISLYARRHALALEMAAQLEQAGIDHILMKGFILREYYPVPELRTFTDIDLVIRPEDRQKSHQLMLSLGFAVKDDWEPIYSYYRGEEYYEIHTRMMEIDVSEKADYQGYFANAWAHARAVSAHSYRFTPEFHFLYMLTHIAKHIHGSGAGIRLYLDVAAFVRRHGGTLDWQWLRQELQSLQLCDFARVVLGAVERWFGIGNPLSTAPVPEEILADFTDFTLEAGVFGHHNRDGALAKMKHQQQDTSGSRTALLLRQIFPKAETIQSRYTYLQDKPWLLPAAWIHRLVKTSADTGKHLDTARQILTADRTEVDQHRKLLKDIGL